MLWTCVYLPDFCLQIFLRGENQRSLIAVSTQSSRPDILACSSGAEQLGIYPGMSVAAALALAPNMRLHVRDEQAERNAFEAIAGWAGQFTSAISIVYPFGLLLEVSTSLRYFRGFKNLIACIETGLRELGWNAVLATSPLPAGSLLLARGGLTIHTRHKSILQAHLAMLSPAFLISAQEHLDTLQRLGIATIEDLRKLPSHGVALRFGPDLMDEIRRATGELPDVLLPFVPQERYRNRIGLPSSVIDSEALLFVIKRLVIELSGFLRVRNAGATRVTVEFIHEDHPPTRLILGLALTRDVEHILRVMRERLTREVLPGGVEAISLESTEVSPLDGSNRDFFPGAERIREWQTQLLERLCARLGDDAVRTIRLHADHRPELASRCLPIASGSSHQEKVQVRPARPVWLLPQPRQLAGHPAALSMTLVAGPERIEGGWWESADIARDYFIADDQCGARCWVFRDKQGQWFMHGLFA